MYSEPETTDETIDLGVGPVSLSEGRAGLRVALRSHDLRFLAAGLAVSQLGDSFLLVALLIIARSLTTNPLAISLLAVSIGLPTVLFGLFAGVLIDRFDRRKVMIVSDIIRGVAVLFLLLVQDASDLPIMMIVGFIMGTAGVLFLPARNALLPRIVAAEGLVAANMLIEATQIAALVIGPALGGLFVTVLGPQAAILFDSASFFVSALCIFLLSTRHVRMHTEKLTSRQLRDEMMEGLRYIRRNELLWRLMLAGAASMLGLGAVIILGTVQIQDVYGIEASGIGALLSVLGLGMVVGGAAVATPWAHIYPALFVGVSMVLLGSSLALFPFLGDFRLALVAILITGASLISLRSVVNALMQMNVPDDRRGRVESANNVVMAASYNASLIASGALGIAIPPTFLFPLAGAFVLGAGVLAFQSIRRLPSPAVDY